MTKLSYLLRWPTYLWPTVGSAEWLVRSEIKYGGYETNIHRRRVSPHDERTSEQLALDDITGGDRMLHHGYAPTYACYLEPFLGAKDLIIAEFGILKGSGLAIWCDLFPQARVIGFDIDLSYFEDNQSRLERYGAFKQNRPEVHVYDQFVSGYEHLTLILKGRTLDIVMDDGHHTVDTIVTTWRSVEPFLSPRFVYFIEDHAGLLKACGNEFASYDCNAFGELTVVSRDVPANAS